MEAAAPPIQLPFRIQTQPDDFSCGPSCLQAIYRYWGDDVVVDDVTREVCILPAGGTLGVLLALHAQRRGYRARIYTYNLKVFDPSWFDSGGRALPHLRAALARRRDMVDDPRMAIAADGYEEYLERGGELRMVDPTPRLLARHLRRGEPILAGLSATWLYRSKRVFGPHDDEDDIRGMPLGHFVVLSGYDRAQRRVHLADPSPMGTNPLSTDPHYAIGVERLIAAILLGIVTYDANLLILSPEARRQP